MNRAVQTDELIAAAVLVSLADLEYRRDALPRWRMQLASDLKAAISCATHQRTRRRPGLADRLWPGAEIFDLAHRK